MFVPAFFVRNAQGLFLRLNPTKPGTLEWCRDRNCSDSFSTWGEALRFMNRLPQQGRLTTKVVDQLGDIWTPARARQHGM